MAWAGILFRRLAGEAEVERARRMVLTGGLPVPEDAATVWFGLWDLSAAEGADLLAVAAVRPAGPRVVELSAFAAPGPGGGGDHGHRLLQEVLDRMRAGGADRLIAPLAPGREDRALLLAAGFLPAEPAQRSDPAGTWLYREL